MHVENLEVGENRFVFGFCRFDESDMPLLLAVAGTHTAHLGMGLI